MKKKKIFLHFSILHIASRILHKNSQKHKRPTPYVLEAVKILSLSALKLSAVNLQLKHKPNELPN